MVLALRGRVDEQRHSLPSISGEWPPCGRCQPDDAIVMVVSCWAGASGCLTVGEVRSTWRKLVSQAQPDVAKPALSRFECETMAEIRYRHARSSAWLRRDDGCDWVT